jgi:hypothetical protein
MFAFSSLRFKMEDLRIPLPRLQRFKAIMQGIFHFCYCLGGVHGDCRTQKAKASGCKTQSLLLQYPGRELNPYSHCWPQDFKSCVSTSSTTRVVIFIKLKKKGVISSHLLSGRRGSNPRPQPWQGCALPTELLPLILTLSGNYPKNIQPHTFRRPFPACRHLKKQDCKNRNCILPAKFLSGPPIYTGAYTAYCPVRLHWACPYNGAYISYKNHQL